MSEAPRYQKPGNSRSLELRTRVMGGIGVREKSKSWRFYGRGGKRSRNFLVRFGDKKTMGTKRSGGRNLRP